MLPSTLSTLIIMVIRLADNYLILPEWTTTKGAQSETHTHSLKEQRAVVKEAFVLLVLSKRWALYQNVGATLSSRDDLMMGLGRERRRSMQKKKTKQ